MQPSPAEKSAGLNKFGLPAGPLLDSGRNLSTQINVDLGKQTLKQGF